MTLAHRTPDAGSPKVGGGALWIGIHVTLKTTRAISFPVTPVSTHSPSAKCCDFRPLKLKCRRAILQESSPGKQALQTSGLIV
jgi:hypothetical protein